MSESAGHLDSEAQVPQKAPAPPLSEWSDPKGAWQTTIRKRRRMLLVSMACSGVALAAPIVATMAWARHETLAILLLPGVAFVVMMVIVIVQLGRLRRTAASVVATGGETCPRCLLPLPPQRPLDAGCRPLGPCCRATAAAWSNEDLVRWWRLSMTEPGAARQLWAARAPGSGLQAEIPWKARKYLRTVLPGVAGMMVIALAILLMPLFRGEGSLLASLITLLPMLLMYLCIIAGAALISLGAGWRLNAGPFCAKCGYRKRESSGHLCPECGADWSVATGVRAYRSTKRPALVVAGLLLAMLGPMSQVLSTTWDLAGMVPASAIIRSLDLRSGYDPLIHDLLKRALSPEERRLLATRILDADLNADPDAKGGDPRLLLRGSTGPWFWAEVTGGHGPVDPLLATRWQQLLFNPRPILAPTAPHPGDDVSVTLKADSLTGGSPFEHLVIEAPIVEALADGSTRPPWSTAPREGVTPGHEPVTIVFASQLAMAPHDPSAASYEVPIRVQLPTATGAHLIRIRYWLIALPSKRLQDSWVDAEGHLRVPADALWARPFETTIRINVTPP